MRNASSDTKQIYFVMRENGRIGQKLELEPRRRKVLVISKQNILDEISHLNEDCSSIWGIPGIPSTSSFQDILPVTKIE